MSKAFAEKIISGMVDENGNCGERGLSNRQFDILSQYLEPQGWDEDEPIMWEGNHKTVRVSSQSYEGCIGRYFVVIEEHWHFHFGASVVHIELRPEEEYEAELEAERRAEAERQRMRELLSFPNGQYKYEPKKRVDLELTLLRDYECEGYSYSYYDDGVFHIYTFADDEGNCFVWKTKNLVCAKDDHNWENPAEVGSRVFMRATIKEHSEYRGVKQNVITRPQIKEVA